MFRVFEGDRQPLPGFCGPIERALYRLSGVNWKQEQTWVQYTAALLAFSLFGVLFTYAQQRLQHLLPLNPQGFGPVSPDSVFQYRGQLHDQHELAGLCGRDHDELPDPDDELAWHNFVSAATGIGIALALARGLTRQLPANAPRTIGNFWVDLIRSTLYVLLPICVVGALVLVATGVIQNFSAYANATTLEGGKQVIAMGPVASQEVIKELGTNGGGFFNANSAHPFENPTPFSNFLELLLIFAIPAAITYTYGLMARDTKQGWALLAAMSVVFWLGVSVCYWAEARGNPIVAASGLEQPIGNMEGKEVRYGTSASALWATVTTDTSCGAVNAMHDSFTPIGGLVPLANMQLGETIFGGVGAGLYGMLVNVLLTVFIAGLMVGRTPELLGKKVESAEMKLVVLYVLIFPLCILGFSAWAAVARYGLSSLNNSGPHGLSEMLYAFTSGAANNGSAFAGISANTPFYNTLSESTCCSADSS
jgi:K+-transporting ATPase ATPase A chain